VEFPNTFRDSCGPCPKNNFLVLWSLLARNASPLFSQVQWSTPRHPKDGPPRRRLNDCVHQHCKYQNWIDAS